MKLIPELCYGDMKLEPEHYSSFILNFLAQLILNPLTTNVPHYIKTSQLICIANQFTCFYMMGNIGH